LKKVKHLDPDIYRIMVTTHASLKNVVLALNEGVCSCRMKPLNMDEVLSTGTTIKGHMLFQPTLDTSDMMVKALRVET